MRLCLLNIRSRSSSRRSSLFLLQHCLMSSVERGLTRKDECDMSDRVIIGITSISPVHFTQLHVPQKSCIRLWIIGLSGPLRKDFGRILTTLSMIPAEWYPSWEADMMAAFSKHQHQTSSEASEMIELVGAHVRTMTCGRSRVSKSA